MAALSDEDRAELAAEYNREISNERVACSAVKSEVRQLFNDLDSYFNTNAAAINQAISADIRNKFTTAEKSRVARMVLQRRFEKGA